MLSRALTCGAGVAVAFGLASPAAALACTSDVSVPVAAKADVSVAAPVTVNAHSAHHHRVHHLVAPVLSDIL